MRRTFLRCSLRQQQPSLGSRRFDDLCDRPSSCVHVRRPGARWGPGATFTAEWWEPPRAQGGSSLCLEGCGACSSARKVGAKLWSVLLLRAAFASVNMRGDRRRLCASSRAREHRHHSGANLPVARPMLPMLLCPCGPRHRSRHPFPGCFLARDNVTGARARPRPLWVEQGALSHGFRSNGALTSCFREMPERTTDRPQKPRERMRTSVHERDEKRRF
jgi:hypothetical protein